MPKNNKNQSDKTAKLQVRLTENLKNQSLARVREKIKNSGIDDKNARYTNSTDCPGCTDCTNHDPKIKMWHVSFKQQGKYTQYTVNDVESETLTLIKDDVVQTGKFHKNSYLKEGTVFTSEIIAEGKFDEESGLIEGILTYTDPKKPILSRKGTFNDDGLVEGTIVFRNGDIQKGKFDENGLLKNGTFTNLQTKVTTIGDFDERGDFIKGKAIYTNQESLFLSAEGTFKDNHITEGLLIFRNKTVNSGSFYNNGYIKKGISLSKDRKLEGEFYENGLLKYGTFTNVKTKTKMTGQFDESGNLIEGRVSGKLGSSDNMVFEGKVLKDNDNGSFPEGVLQYDNGLKIEGTFYNNFSLNTGVITFPTNTTLEFKKTVTNNIQKNILEIRLIKDDKIFDYSCEIDKNDATYAELKSNFKAKADSDIEFKQIIDIVNDELNLIEEMEESRDSVDMSSFNITQNNNLNQIAAQNINEIEEKRKSRKKDKQERKKEQTRSLSYAKFESLDLNKKDSPNKNILELKTKGVRSTSVLKGVKNVVEIRKGQGKLVERIFIDRETGKEHEYNGHPDTKQVIKSIEQSRNAIIFNTSVSKTDSKKTNIIKSEETKFEETKINNKNQKILPKTDFNTNSFQPLGRKK